MGPMGIPVSCTPLLSSLHLCDSELTPLGVQPIAEDVLVLLRTAAHIATVLSERHINRYYIVLHCIILTLLLIITLGFPSRESRNTHRLSLYAASYSVGGGCGD